MWIGRFETLSNEADHLCFRVWTDARLIASPRAFAVKIGFYRIGDSAPAPILTCLVEPSNWIKEKRKAEVAASHWTIPEFLDQIGDEADRSTVKALLARLETIGGRYWCGRRGGSIHLHPLPDQSATLGLSLNTRGQVCVSGLGGLSDDDLGHHQHDRKVDQECPASGIVASPIEKDSYGAAGPHVGRNQQWHACALGLCCLDGWQRAVSSHRTCNPIRIVNLYRKAARYCGSRCIGGRNSDDGTLPRFTAWRSGNPNTNPVGGGKRQKAGFRTHARPTIANGDGWGVMPFKLNSG